MNVNPPSESPWAESDLRGWPQPILPILNLRVQRTRRLSLHGMGNMGNVRLDSVCRTRSALRSLERAHQTARMFWGNIRMNKWRKGIASWTCGETLYLSVPFTWLLPEAESIAVEYARKRKGAKVVAGGPAVGLAQSDAPNTPAKICWAETPGATPFDVLAMHNPCATFTTRGCPNHCPFCAVPVIEGPLRELDRWKSAPIVCDNNLLAASREHFEKVVESLRPFPSCDFNQGLDARLFTRWHADKLATLRWPMVRFAFDHASEEKTVLAAIETARSAGLCHFGVYVLIGFRDTPADALHRLETVREWKIRPNPMRFQPLDSTDKDQHVGAGWTEHELRRMQRYYSRLRYLEHIPYSEYNGAGDDTPLFDNMRPPQSDA